MFSINGFDETSVNDIVKEVGIAKGTFYHYFKSKDELLDQMIDIMMEGYQGIVNEIMEKDINGLEKLKLLFEKIYESKLKEKEYLNSLMNFLLKKENEKIYQKLTRKRFEFMDETFSKIIYQVKKEGNFKIENVEELSSHLVVMLSYTGDIEKLLNDRGYREKMLEAKKDILIKVLGLEHDYFNFDKFKW